MNDTPERDFSPLAERALIIGLDGVTFDVLNPLMAEGRMPRLAAAIEGGTSGVLHSTVPPITPAAWTTFLTGVQPGTHGIIDFERYDPLTNKLGFNSTRCLDHVRTIWRTLGDRGFRVGSLHVPMTYPAVPVNGFMVSGFEAPGANSDFVFPSDAKEWICSRWPDPTLRAKWGRSVVGARKTFRRNIDYLCKSFHQDAEMTVALGDRFGWDVLMVVMKLTDNLQHKTWKYLDPRWSGRDPFRRDLTKHAFEEADRAVGTLLDYATTRGATAWIVSDHGHGSLEGKVQPNRLLQEWGYLSLHAGAAQSQTRGRYVWDRLLGRTRKFARAGDIAHDLAVDFDRTRACVMHAGMAGFLYLNLQGRQPCGVVAAGEYERLRDELRRRFLGEECRAVDPAGRRVQLFSAVHKPEELYGCSREAQPWMPDLLLMPHDSLAVVRKIRGAHAVRWLPYRKIEGTHRPEGVFVASGPGVKRGNRIEARLVDCAPTLLAMLGLRVPAEMEGRVVSELFDRPVVVERSASAKDFPRATDASAPDHSSSAEQVYSEAELQAVTDRLSDLGYLE